jgi:hypothetical protein
MTRLIGAFLFFAIYNTSFAQESIIVLRDSVKVKSELISISENNLFTKAGTFGLVEIYSIRFQTTNDMTAKSHLVDQLLENGIIVYAAEKKLDAKPLKTSGTIRTQQPSSSRQPVVSQPQKNTDDDEKEDLSSGSFGVGFGQDYGGIGARLTFLPDQHVGFFGSVGYIFAGAGYNIGVMARIKPENRTVPTISVMYGYNAAIKITGASQYDKIYNGVSLGFGIISKSYRDPKNYWHFGLILPFRSSEFDSDFNALKANPGIVGLEKPWPVTISIGYHFSF